MYEIYCIIKNCFSYYKFSIYKIYNKSRDSSPDSSSESV